MYDQSEELNRSVREGRIESRHFIKSLEGMGSSSHDLGAELRMHSFTANCDTACFLFVPPATQTTKQFELKDLVAPETAEAGRRMTKVLANICSKILRGQIPKHLATYFLQQI